MKTLATSKRLLGIDSTGVSYARAKAEHQTLGIIGRVLAIVAMVIFIRSIPDIAR